MSLHAGCEPTECRAVTTSGATSFPPPLAAELGFTRVRPHMNWPKSDKSDFGWRDREGARNMTEHFKSPSPQPSPASEGGSRPSVLLLFHADNFPGQWAPFFVFGPIKFREGCDVIRRGVDGVARQTLARIRFLQAFHHRRVELAHDVGGNAPRPRERKPDFGDEPRKTLLRKSWNIGEIGNALARRDREWAHLSTQNGSGRRGERP